RPQSKRQKEHQNLISNLQVGDRIITIGGIYGRIDSIREDSYIIKVESGELIRMAKSSIAGKQADEAK
ncbi:MAG: preprotein translocase subunit YajC, partial [Dehalococcoidales bacterium]|nr:preprotein translocase subunit YajC [Dehalococcoidales bacterium]